MANEPALSPYLSQKEPTFDEALRWFPDMPKPWGSLGWKDHLFEFVILWNGSVVMPIGGRPAKTRTLEHLKQYEAQISFFPTIADTPWRWGSMGHVVDNNSIRQWIDGILPIVVTEHYDDVVLIEQRTFCHVPGGTRLRRGDEPLFAWVRFEIKKTLGRVKKHEELSVWTHIGVRHLQTSMTPGTNVKVTWPAPVYPRGLSLVDDSIVMQTDGLARLGVMNPRQVAFEPGKGGPNEENFLRVRMRCKPGESFSFVIPFMPLEKEILAQEMKLGWKQALEETLTFWEKELRRGARVSVPDDLATRTFGVLPWQLFTIAEKNPHDKEYVLNTSAMHYEGVWATPFAAINGWGLDYLGFHQEAENYLELFRRHQGEVEPPSKQMVPHDGFLTTPPRFETIKWISDHGAILYGSALHALLTDDRRFIEKWLPVWEKGLDWIRVQRRVTKRPFVRGLLPAGQATDDFQHFQFVWNDGWAHHGMRHVIEILKRIGDRSAKKWEREADDYQRTFLRAIRRAAKRAGTFETIDGETYPFVPTNVNSPLAPANDEAFYLDTGPLFAIFVGLIPPHDPLADATLAFFRKGPNVATYRPESTPWQPPILFHEISSCEPVYSWNIGTSLLRGDRVPFVEGLFAMITGGQSTRILWDIETRNGVFGLCGSTPAAIWLLRHAMIHESANGLELLRIPPKDWLRGNGIELKGIPTWFGKATIHTWMEDSVLHLEASLPKREPVDRVVVHIPDFGKECQVTVNGRRQQVTKSGTIALKPDETKLEVDVRYSDLR